MYKVVLVLLFVLIQGCASNKFTKTEIYQDGVSLKGQSILVYSFLDIRKKEFGTKMLKSLNNQLISGFQAENINAEVIDFLDSEAALSFSISNSGQLPVEAFVNKNMENENAFGSHFRLIIIPSQMTIQGANKHYEIRWNLVDSNTNTVVWKAFSEGSHSTWAHTDENPEGRAKAMLKYFFLNLKHHGLL